MYAYSVICGRPASTLVHVSVPTIRDSYGFYLIFMRTWKVNERKASTSLCGTIQRVGKSSIIGCVSVLFPFFVQTWESRRENCGRVRRWHQSNTPGWLYKAKPRRQREHQKNTRGDAPVAAVAAGDGEDGTAPLDFRVARYI